MYKRLINVLSIPSSAKNTLLMSNYILNEVAKKKAEVLVDAVGNLLITKGQSETYPCITAHLDTVHNWGNVVIKENNGVLSSPTGIGGDDKCGVFICLELLNKLPVLKIAFFQGEEIGCVGSKAVDLNWFKDCRYVIGIDRKGNSDIITSYMGTKAASKHFRKTIGPTVGKFGYSKSSGLITDAFTLANRKVGVSCCNISCGYYDPHQDEETVVAEDVFKALRFVDAMIKVLGEEVYSHSYSAPIYNYGGYQNNKSYDCCAKCKQWKNNTVWLVGTGYICKDCLRQQTNTNPKAPSNQKVLPAPKNECDTCLWKDKRTGGCLAGNNDFCPKEKDPCINCEHIMGFSPECKDCKQISNYGIPAECLNCGSYGDREEDCKNCPVKFKEFCDKHLTCLDCPKFETCNEQKARSTRIKQHTVGEVLKGQGDCEQCRASELWEPEWCEDCRISTKMPAPEFLE